MQKINELADRYVAVWNEPDAERRRQRIAALWAEDGAHLTATLEARGYAALEDRVASAYERWVHTEGFVFRLSREAVGHHNAVKLYWEMTPATGSTVAGAGSDLLLLGDDGRISYDYQFTEPLPSS